MKKTTLLQVGMSLYILGFALSTIELCFGNYSMLVVMCMFFIMFMLFYSRYKAENKALNDNDLWEHDSDGGGTSTPNRVFNKNQAWSDRLGKINNN